MDGLEALIRTLTTTTTRRATKEVHPGYSKLRVKMAEFQVDNGQPIHLKGGVIDNVLFISTVGLTAVGLGMCLQFFYSMAFPPKKQ
ncbi:cytochrome c oxidase subunit 7A, mitochondrial-like isoform X2 [Eriocheir sinensis]|uniref:cytochrome c oxidase subunit 7A, mitochondrial-like isoform X2 n=1 Tax=Eriocheir sinensis TaxID=95602 RepID=UPI0021C6D801|nr:cytochrome c oxidase subunit 7A, mitochondrial-like isoform X2 [Eriocheir sinensis]